jgi:hypothetical protein
LQRQRSDGGGPPFIQLSARRIGYRKSTVEQWLEARTIERVGGLVEQTTTPRGWTRGRIMNTAAVNNVGNVTAAVTAKPSQTELEIAAGRRRAEHHAAQGGAKKRQRRMPAELPSW